jgi:hypothetical protein
LGRYSPNKQRAALKKLATALNSSSTALRIDECGDPRINGAHGYVYAICGTLDEPKAPGFQLYLDSATPRAWTAAKKVIIPFANVLSDGDTEGMFVMHRLPSDAEAKVIRSYLGIRKRRCLSDDARAASVERLAAARASINRVAQAQRSAKTTAEAHS